MSPMLGTFFSTHKVNLLEKLIAYENIQFEILRLPQQVLQAEYEFSWVN